MQESTSQWLRNFPDAPELTVAHSLPYRKSLDLAGIAYTVLRRIKAFAVLKRLAFEKQKYSARTLWAQAVRRFPESISSFSQRESAYTLSWLRGSARTGLHILWGPIQNENVRSLIQRYSEFHVGDSRALSQGLASFRHEVWCSCTSCTPMSLVLDTVFQTIHSARTSWAFGVSQILCSGAWWSTKLIVCPLGICNVVRVRYHKHKIKEWNNDEIILFFFLLFRAAPAAYGSS